MSTKEMESKVKEVKELRAMMSELQDEIAAIEDEIKAYMREIGSETLQAGIFKVLYKTVQTTRFDQKPSKRRTEHYTRNSRKRRKAAASRLCEGGEHEAIKNRAGTRYLVQRSGGHSDGIHAQ